MLAHWGALEADFAREYRMDLNVEAWRMTWRRLGTLISGLSPASLWVLAGRKATKAWKSGGWRRINDPAEAERYFEAIR